MKIDITFITPHHYDWYNIGWWVWYYRPYKFIKGFNFRMFGFHFNVRENKAFEKLINQIV